MTGYGKATCARMRRMVHSAALKIAVEKQKLPANSIARLQGVPMNTIMKVAVTANEVAPSKKRESARSIKRPKKR